MSGFDVVGGQIAHSAEEGMAMTFFTNAMQRGYNALQQLGIPTHELRAVCRDIERYADDAGKGDDPNVQTLLGQLGERIPKTTGGWA